MNIHLPESPDVVLNRQKAVVLLTEAGCKLLLVQKLREAKKWRAPNGIVKVEWACISKPQPVVSIGLENWSEVKSAELSDESAKEDLYAAIDFLELHREPLNTMNYMDVVEVWSGGGTL